MIIAAGAIGQGRDHVQVPWHRAEHQPLTRPHLDEDLGSFGGGEEQVAGPPGRG